MAWNNDPEIRHLREYSKLFDAPVVVVFAIKRDGGKFSVSSYGETQQLCQVASDIGDQIHRLVTNGTIAPNIACPGCHGCGQVANTDEGEPWTVWEGLPEDAKAGVYLGVVKPVPCPECGGKK